MFGGAVYSLGGVVMHADTWEWDGATWHDQGLAPGPLPRRHAGLAYEPAGERIIMFGGEATDDGSVLLDDTWAYGADGTWVPIESPIAPVARDTPMMTYDPVLGAVVMFGGDASGNLLADTWALVDDVWTDLRPIPTPPTRRDHMLAYSPALERNVLFGGYSLQSGHLGDTWTLGYLELVAGEACATASDYDRDGLRGCDDDECWQVCTPGCPPTAAPGACDGLPHCGDGTCGDGENCRLCPDDCDVDDAACPVLCGDGHCDDAFGEVVATCPGDCSAP